jgi:hypothetical protein
MLVRMQLHHADRTLADPQPQRARAVRAHEVIAANVIGIVSKRLRSHECTEEHKCRPR